MVHCSAEHAVCSLSLMHIRLDAVQKPPEATRADGLFSTAAARLPVRRYAPAASNDDVSSAASGSSGNLGNLGEGELDADVVKYMYTGVLMHAW